MWRLKIIPYTCRFWIMEVKSIIFMYGDSEDDSKLIGRIKDEDERDLAIEMLQDAFNTMLNRPAYFEKGVNGQIYIRKSLKENRRE